MIALFAEQIRVFEDVFLPLTTADDASRPPIKNEAIKRRSVRCWWPCDSFKSNYH